MRTNRAQAKSFLKSICVGSLLLLLIACGSGSGAGEAESTTSSRSPRATGSSPDDASGRSHPDGLFQTAPAPALRVCREGLSPGTTVARPIAVERLNRRDVCFVGFLDDPSSPLHVALTAPDGSQREADASKVNGGWLWQVIAAPDLPLGSHGFRASQPAGEAGGLPLETTGRVEIVRATSPSVYQVEPESPDLTLQIRLAGFPPSSLVAVFLYGPPGAYGRLPFVRALPAAQIDDSGEGNYSWKAESGHQPGTYGVWLNPGDCNSACAFFQIP